MGAGLALCFARRFPGLLERYKGVCQQKRLLPGDIWLDTQVTPMVLHFATKDHWSQPSKLDSIERGLLDFCSSYEQWGITSIAFPKLGCGLGGLLWGEVQPLMKQYLLDLPISVMVYVGKEKT